MRQDCGVARVRIHHEGELSLPGSVVTAGAFDGVHLGHQELIRRTVQTARGLGLPAVVYTFDVLPKVFFGKAEALIPPTDRIRRICAFEPDHIIVARFDKNYSGRAAAGFVAELKALNPRQVLVGEDFRFGANQSGDVDLLRRHFETRVIEPVRCGAGEVVSSSRIRRLRQSGRIAAAAVLEGWKDMSALSAFPARGTLLERVA
jgi:riboflavin kinase / FMN adenylyltransferase